MNTSKGKLPKNYNHAQRVVYANGKPKFVPFYINPDPKPVSKDELLKALKEVNDKNERDHYEMMRDTAQAFHGGLFVCMPRKPRT